MILGFTKHAWGKHNLFIKLGGGTLGFIGENLGRAKGKFFFFFFCLSHGFVFYYGVSKGIRSGSFN
jgi:hypothetical protein